MLSALRPLQLFFASVRRAFSGPRQPQNRAPSDRVTIRRVDPQVAMVYLPPHGTLSEGRPPGGAGPARSVHLGDETLAQSAGPALSLRELDIPQRDRGDPESKTAEPKEFSKKSWVREDTQRDRSIARYKDITAKPESDAAEAAARYRDLGSTDAE